MYPKPVVVGKISAEVFDGISAQYGERFSHRIDFDVEHGTAGEAYASDGGSGLIEPARLLGVLLLSNVRDANKVHDIGVFLRRGGKQVPERWHIDFVPKHGGAIAVANQNTTIFAYGRRLGIDYGRAFDQPAAAAKIANGLKKFRAEPYEAVLFDGHTLHTKPNEDISNRLFMLAIVRS